MQIVKPPHNHYALSFLDEATYVKYAKVYAISKRWGVRGIYAFIGGTGMTGVIKEIAKGTMVQYGKRRLATAVIAGATYVCATAVAVLTNATKVVKMCKVAYTSVGVLIEAFEDASHVTFVPVDIVIFGQLIPANEEGRFSSWSKITDLIDQLPTIGDGN
jgi:hypothetical protein